MGLDMGTEHEFIFYINYMKTKKRHLSRGVKDYFDVVF